MKFWVEVFSGEWNWQGILKGERDLNALNQTRYLNLFYGVEPGDIVFHYITSSMTRDKKKSSVLGASEVISRPYIKNKKIIAEIGYTVEFPALVRFKDLKNICRASREFSKLLSLNMQRYLTEITQLDAYKLLSVYPENLRLY